MSVHMGIHVQVMFSNLVQTILISKLQETSIQTLFRSIISYQNTFAFDKHHMQTNFNMLIYC
jgi:hypothetical protein